jgi:hypothetical protein
MSVFERPDLGFRVPRPLACGADRDRCNTFITPETETSWFVAIPAEGRPRTEERMDHPTPTPPRRPTQPCPWLGQQGAELYFHPPPAPIARVARGRRAAEPMQAQPATTSRLTADNTAHTTHMENHRPLVESDQSDVIESGEWEW